MWQRPMGHHMPRQQTFGYESESCLQEADAAASRTSHDLCGLSKPEEQVCGDPTEIALSNPR